MRKPDLSVDLNGLKLHNPITVASGTFGFGREYSEYVDLNNIGAIMVKGLTLAPKLGNDSPRVAETAMGMLNSVGLQNPGVEYFLKNDLPWLGEFNTKVIANINGTNIEEYCRIAELTSVKGVHSLELNISCPNVKAGGLAFGTDPDMVYRVVKEVREATGHHLIVKLSPNVKDIKDIALAAEAGGADCLSMINTLTGMVIDIDSRKPILARGIGGLSGPAVKPVAVRMVYEAASVVGIPIIGMGGIANYRDAVEFLLAGAGAISIGTSNFVNPKVTEEVLNDLENWMMKNGYNSIDELVGKLDFPKANAGSCTFEVPK
ncbi:MULTISPECIES: dihydroorotate dehydrogenase [unclassified Fusibacter]|uniref:dihydroorotate dehydrogenase n=1 Tax=unclassified Fusibacter TaxID=2624464 RepID=UPI0014950DB6|nr:MULTISPECIES: dihydroorotate dehydrogenase [unclassified Fusibacter]MCK8061563.1 dihydroorotate dehydrogenase [Fusibacter sp. A2]